ncbi:MULTISPECIES: hypothetical protein [Gordonia]|uniref:hypothetical protein n=1 Tax=Gordonia TaxID=2053 RepID=UPI003265E7F5
MKTIAKHREPAFAQACRSARSRLVEAIDLIIIHNEKHVRGNQPRTVLNPMTVLLAVSAWERLLTDLEGLQSDTDWPGPELYQSKTRGISWPDKAFPLITSVTNDLLPSEFDVVLFTGYTGKVPDEAIRSHGRSDELTSQLSAWIATRNGVAHHCLPQQAVKHESVWRSDADGSNGLTIQAGAARACAALMVQLVDQVIRAVALTSGFSLRTSELLPSEWFASESPAKLRGVENPGSLWGGTALARPAFGS